MSQRKRRSKLRKDRSHQASTRQSTSRSPLTFRHILEPLEDRLLLTVLVGGDTFEFQDAANNTVRVVVQGNAIVQLIGAELDDQGQAILGNIQGTFTGSAIGEQEIAVTGVQAIGNTPIVDNLPAQDNQDAIPWVAPPTGNANINIGGLASRVVSGVSSTYGINEGNVPFGTNGATQRTVVQLLSMDTSTDANAGTGTVIANLQEATLEEDAAATLSSGVGALTSFALDPVTGNSYVVNNFDDLFKITPAGTVTPIGTINLNGTTVGAVNAMAFNTAGDLYVITNNLSPGISNFTTQDMALVQVNIANADANDSDVTAISSTGAFVTDNFSALTFNPTTDLAYAVDNVPTIVGTAIVSTSPTLEQITLSSGGEVSEGVISLPAAATPTVQGLAFASNSTGGTILVGLDTNTSTATTTGSSGSQLIQIPFVLNAASAVSSQLDLPGSVAAGLAGLASEADTSTPGRYLLYSSDGTDLYQGSAVEMPVNVGTGGSYVSAIDGATFDGVNAGDPYLYFVATDNSSGADSDRLYRINVDAGSRAEIQNSMTLISGTFGAQNGTGTTTPAVHGIAFDPGVAPGARADGDLVAFVDDTVVIPGVNGAAATSGAGGQVVAVATAAQLDGPTVTFSTDNADYNAAVTVTLTSGTGVAQVTNVTGISFLGQDAADATNFVYATTANGADSAVLRIRLAANSLGPAGTAFVMGIIPQQPDTLVPIPPLTGEDIGAITWNPLYLNPFTGTLGTLLGTDLATDQLVAIDTTLRLANADVFQVYVSQGGDDAQFAMAEVPPPSTTGVRAMEPYSGSSGGFYVIPNPVGYPAGDETTDPIGYDIPGTPASYSTLVHLISPPSTAGEVYVGLLTINTSTTTGFVTGPFPVTTAPLTTTLELRPAAENDVPAGDPNGYNVAAGVEVAPNLLQYVSPSTTVAGAMMGATSSTTTDHGALTLTQYITLVEGMAVTQAGQIYVVHSSTTVDTDEYGDYLSSTATTGDQITELDPTTGLAESGTTFNVTNSVTGLPLDDLQAMAYGDPNLDGNQQLYAVYNVGGVTTLGILNPATGVFTPVAEPFGNTQVAVQAIAFAPGSSTLDPGDQALYMLADPSGTLTAAGNPISNLYEVRYTKSSTTGFINGVQAIIQSNSTGIGEVEASENDVLTPLVISSMAFNPVTGNLLGVDQSYGRLVDINLTTAFAGGVVSTAVGSVRPTVAAISYDFQTGLMLAADNVTGQLAASGAAPSASPILMSFRGLNNATPTSQNFNDLFIGGTVTGIVHFSGSVSTVYIGWIETGVTIGYGVGDPYGFPDGGPQNEFVNNFYVGGNIQYLMTDSIIGSNADQALNTGILDTQLYLSGFDMYVGGKIGWIDTTGSLYGSVEAVNSPDLPASDELPVEQSVLEAIDEAPEQPGEYFQDFELTNGAEFSNDSNKTPQILAPSYSIGANGEESDVAMVQGFLFWESGGTSNFIDYYGVALMAGQTVTVELNATPDAEDDGTIFGIFDPAGRLIASSFDGRFTAAVEDTPVTFTATMPGLFEIAVTTITNTQFAGTPPVLETAGIYQLTVTGLGNVGLAGITAGSTTGGNIWYQNVSYTTGEPVSVPYITVDNGDLGLIQAGDLLEATDYEPDISVPEGNLRDVTAGYWGNGDVDYLAMFDTDPTLSVGGSVGMLMSTSGWLVVNPDAATTPAIGGNYQMIDADTDFWGNLIADGSIGTVDAGSVATLLPSNSSFEIPEFGAPEFEINANGLHPGATIDLVDGAGDLGNPESGGPYIDVGPAGSFRYMVVGGNLYQNAQYGTGAAYSEEQISHAIPISSPELLAQGQKYVLIDSSGGSVTLAPTSVPTTPDQGYPAGTTAPTITTPSPTTPGQLSILTYGIGSGGVALVKAISTTGLNVSGSSTGNGKPVAISEIDAEGTGISAVTNVDFNVTVPDQDANTETLDVTISSNGNTPVDVFDVVGGTFTEIEDSTPDSEIVNVNATSIGTLYSRGNIGFSTSNIGVAVSQITDVVPTGFPWDQQRNAIVSAGDIDSIVAGGAIGNVSVTGSIGNIVADSGGSPPPGDFAGLVGPIVATDDIESVNIGQGIPTSGSGDFAQAGLFAGGLIYNVVNNGTGSDIRGDVVAAGLYEIFTLTTTLNGVVTSQSSQARYSIQNITLTNGSIINARIMASPIADAEIWFDSSPDDNNFVSGTGTIQNVVTNGIGGIIGSDFEASTINNLEVVGGGFGILNTDIYTDPTASNVQPPIIPAPISFTSSGTTTTGTIQLEPPSLAGHITNIVASGFGLRDDEIIAGLVIGNLIATGNGAALSVDQYESTVRGSEAVSTNGAIFTDFNDLPTFIESTGDNLTSGLIDDVEASGALNLTEAEAYAIGDNSSFDFANSIGTIVTDGLKPSGKLSIYGLSVTTGKLKVFKPDANVEDLQMNVAGPITSIVIPGNFLSGTGDEESYIDSSGPNGYIGTFEVAGDMDGNISSSGIINTILIGGDFNGDISASGSNAPLALTLLGVGGAFNGTLDITGNIGEIETGGSLGSSGDTLTTSGNINLIRVGVNPADPGSTLGLDLNVAGNLNTLTVTGTIEGEIVVDGNVTTITDTNDSLTGVNDPSNHNLIQNSVLITGHLGTATITGGGIANNTVFQAGNGIGTMTVRNGNVGALVSSIYGGIGTFSITNGSLLGGVEALNGSIGTLTLTGASSGLGADVTIAAMSTGSINIGGGMAGGSIAVTNMLSTLMFGGAVSGGSISAGGLTSLSVGTQTVGSMLASLTVGGLTSSSSVRVSQNLGADVSIRNSASISVAGNVLSGVTIGVGMLPQLTVGGALMGDVIVQGTAGAISAGSMSGSVVTTASNLTSLRVGGLINQSILQVGISPGVDGVYAATVGEKDQGEGSSLATIGSVSAGAVTNSILDSSGDFGQLTVTGAMTDSSASSGFALGSFALEGVISGDSPLTTVAGVSAARAGADRVLRRGNIASAVIGSMVDSDVTAGVAPDTNGNFGVNSSVLIQTAGLPQGGGLSTIGKIQATADANSVVQAKSGITSDLLTGSALVDPTMTYSISQLTTNVPLAPGELVGTATPAAPLNLILDGQSVTVSITGPLGSSVAAYVSDPSSSTLDSLIITGTTLSSTLTVTNAGPVNINIGRILSAANTALAAIYLKGGINLVGDGTADPALWIDSGLNAFSFNNLGNSFVGQVGGNISTLTIANQGGGTLNVLGTVTNLSIGGSTTAASLAVLSTVTGAPFDNIAIASNGTVYGTQLTTSDELSQVNLTTGATIDPVPVIASATGTPITLQGLTVRSSTSTPSLNGLWGITDLSTPAPTLTVGALSSNANATIELRGLTVGSLAGVSTIYAIETVPSANGNAAYDELVTINPTTGLATAVAPIKDVFGDSFTNNIIQLAADDQGDIYAITNDLDGDGPSYGQTPTDPNSVLGYGMGLLQLRIGTDAQGNATVTAGSPIGNYLPGKLLTLGGQSFDNQVDAMAIDPASGALYIVRRNNAGTGDELYTVNITGVGGTVGQLTAVGGGATAVDGLATHIIGMAFNANGDLIALNQDGSNTELLELQAANAATDPTQFLRLTAQDALSGSLASYALDPSTGTADSYSLTTAVGTFFTSGSAVPTLGTIDAIPSSATYGQFFPVYVLSVNAGGTPLSGTIVGVAADNFPGDAGNFFVGTSNGEVYQFSATTGALVGSPLTLTDASGHRINISGIFFDTVDDQLDAIDSTFDRRVSINLTSGVVTPQSPSGSIPNTNTVTAALPVALDPATDQIVAFYDATASTPGEFVSLGTVPVPTQPGIFALNIGSIRVTGNSTYSGEIDASGNIGSVTMGGGFSGGISAGGTMGAVTINGNLSGALDAGGNLTGVTVNGSYVNVLSSALISTGGSLNKFSIPRTYTIVNNVKTPNTFGGVIEAQWAPSLSIGADVSAGSSIDVAYSASATFGGNFAGSFTTGTNVGGLAIGGNVVSLMIAGSLLSGATIDITGNSGSVSIGQSVQTDSEVNVAGATTSFKVGGTLAGQMSSGLGLGTGTFGAGNGGLLDVGLNTTSVTFAGSVTNTILSFGTQIGPDGVYDTSDDVITGGSVKTVSIGGNFINSVIAAGVLPSIAVGPFVPGVSDTHAFSGNPTSSDISLVSSAEAGGLLPSSIGSVSIRGQVSNNNGQQSSVVAATSIGKVSVYAGASNLVEHVYSNTIGPPTVVSAGLIDTTTLQVVFSKAINTGSLSVATAFNPNGSGNGSIILVDAYGNLITDATLSYTTQTTSTGAVEGVLDISVPTAYPVSFTLTIQGLPNADAVYDLTGRRSSLNFLGNNDTDPLGNVLQQNYVGVFGNGAAAHDFQDAIAQGPLDVTVDGPTLQIAQQFASNTAVDVYEFTASAYQFVRVNYTGPGAMMAIAYEDLSTTGPGGQPTFDLVNTWQDQTDQPGVNGIVEADELPVTGTYFLILARDVISDATASENYNVSIQLASSDTALLANIPLPAGIQIAYISHSLNAHNNQLGYSPAKQLVYVDFTGGTPLQVLPGEPVSALSLSTIFPSVSAIAGQESTLINGSSTVTGIMANLLSIYQASQPSLNAQVITNISDYTNATSGLFFTTTDPSTAGLNPGTDYITIFVGETAASTASDDGLDGNLAASSGVGLSDNNKAMQSIVFAQNFNSLGINTTQAQAPLLNQLSVSFANVIAHELGLDLGFNYTNDTTLTASTSLMAPLTSISVTNGLLSLGNAAVDSDQLNLSGLYQNAPASLLTWL